jgi:two-component system cell cycle response regulator
MERWLPTPLAVRVGVAVAAAWLLVHELHATLFGGTSFGFLTHRFAHLAVLAVGSLSCLLAGRRPGPERMAWTLIGVGLLCWTAGEAYYATLLWDDASPPIPSPSDVGYLLFPLLLLPGLALLIRDRVRGASPTVWADGVIVGLAVSALSAAVIFQTLIDHVAGDPLGVTVALAYPLTDMLMLSAMAGSLAGIGWQLDRRWSLLAAGVVAFWLADTLYAVSAVAGTYTAGGTFDAGWWAGLLAIGVAAWQPGERRAVPQGDALRLILVPLAFGSIGLALLIYATVEPLNALAVVLAALSLVAVMGRLLLTFREYAAMLRQSRSEALTDPLTGLGNRRALSSSLAGALPEAAEADPLVLVLFDLDGFKHYNDSFGHPAGDELLVRLADALRDHVRGRGVAYRMGGDEFCVVLRLAGEGADPVIAGAVAALSERGEDFHVSCSYGAITLPREASDVAQALRVADQRMYAHKHARRGPTALPGESAQLQQRPAA